MGTVPVSRDDLAYLLAHVSDEINGHPDPAHWRLPLITAAIRRLTTACTAEPADPPAENRTLRDQETAGINVVNMAWDHDMEKQDLRKEVLDIIRQAQTRPVTGEDVLRHGTMREMIMIEAGLTVQAAGKDCPVTLDANGTFRARLDEGHDITADTFAGLRKIAGQYKAQRFELPFTASNGTDGVITGFHATSNRMLVRWEDGRHSQESEYMLRGAMPRLDTFDHSALDKLILAVSEAQAALTQFTESRAMRDIRAEAEAAQRKAAGLGGDDA